jgi:hypothetical protein
LSSCEKEGAAANATDAAHSNGRMRRLSNVVAAIHKGRAGLSHIFQEGQLIDT